VQPVVSSAESLQITLVIINTSEVLISWNHLWGRYVNFKITSRLNLVSCTHCSKLTASKILQAII